MKYARFSLLLAAACAAAVGGILTTVGAGHAQNDVGETRRNALVRAIERAAPTVVSINVVVQRRTTPFDTGFWDFFYMPAPQLEKVESVGSGFIFDKEGHIITNYHVIEGADAIDSVTLPDGRRLQAEFVGADKRTDIAVLRAVGENLPSIALGDSDDLIIGEWVVAIGNPFGGLIRDPEPSVSVGVVSANHRRLSHSIGRGERLYQDMIQTDAAINPGNSGGPLVDAFGNVVGVNTMIVSPSGGSIGLGFAIPINRVRRVTAEIIEFGKRRDSWPGFRVEDIAELPPQALRAEGISATSGCVVVNILRDSPAFRAGLQPGDVITSINGQPVQSSWDIDFVVWDSFVGDQITLEVERNGVSRTIGFIVEELPRQ